MTHSFATCTLWWDQAGKLEDAKAVLKSIRGPNCDQEQIESDFHSLETMPSEDVGDINSVFEELKSKVHGGWAGGL